MERNWNDVCNGLVSSGDSEGAAIVRGYVQHLEKQIRIIGRGTEAAAAMCNESDRKLAVAVEALGTAAMWAATSEDPGSKMSANAINEALAKIDAIGKGEE